MTKRKALSKKTRFEIFKRDEFICQYCGSHPPAVILHVDHIIPVKEGGGNEMDNLITSCSSCNLGKSANSLDNIPISLKEKSDLIKESEAQIKAYSKVMSEKKDRIYTESWKIVACLENRDYVEEYGSLMLRSIQKFLDVLDYFEVEDAAFISNSKFPNSTTKRFKYFCGICWNKVRGE